MSASDDISIWLPLKRFSQKLLISSEALYLIF